MSKVVECMIPVFYHLTKILIDSGATHSFVNPNFMCEIDVKVERLPHDLKVRTPIGDQCLIINMVYRNYKVWVRERKLVVDFISLAIKGYDVIEEWIG